MRQQLNGRFSFSELEQRERQIAHRRQGVRGPEHVARAATGSQRIIILGAFYLEKPACNCQPFSLESATLDSVKYEL